MDEIAALQALDGDAWTRIERVYFRRIFFYVRRFVKDFQRAEDLTQETFLASIKAIGNYNRSYNMEQYLFGIAHNKVIDHLRRQGRSPLVFGGGTDDDERSDFFSRVEGGPGTPSKIVVEDENFLRRRKQLTAALRQLWSDLWTKGEIRKLQIVELVFLKRWKHARIAEMFDIADEKAIAGIKFRAIRTLKQLLRERDPNQTLFEDLWKEP